MILKRKKLKHYLLFIYLFIMIASWIGSTILSLLVDTFLQDVREGMPLKDQLSILLDRMDMTNNIPHGGKNNIHICPVGWGCRICRLYLCRGITPPLQWGHLFCCRWSSVIPEYRNLVAEQSMTRVYKWSYDRQHSSLVLTWVRQVVGKAHSDQSVGHVKP